MRHSLTVVFMALFSFGVALGGFVSGEVKAAGMEKMTEAEKRAKDPRNKNYRVGDKASGYVYMTSQTRDMQDDDFSNPAFTWVDLGESKWSEKNGSEGKSCASCHNDASNSMKGVANNFPKYDPLRKRLISLQAKVNDELTKRMGAKKWKWESDNMLGMAAYIKLQSRGMPVTAKIDGEAKPFFEKGKAFFNQRRGLLDMACKHCHDDNPGNMARSNVLSEAQMNGFPTYRFKWQKPGSLHRRYIGCNKNIRAKPYKRGSEEYTNLELYMAWRSSGLKWETPAVRN
jgi:L-cysteine S-thiosulfotransferase